MSRARAPNGSLLVPIDNNLALYKAQLTEGRKVTVHRLTNDKRGQSKRMKIHLRA